MKNLLFLWALIMAGLLPLGCAPSEQAPPAVEATPTPAGEIADMDFESGEVASAESSEASEPDSPPDAQ